MTTRREFLKILSSGTACLYLSSVAPAMTLSGCDSSHGSSLSGIINWEAIRNNQFKLNKTNIYVNNSTLGPTLKLVSQKMAAIQEMFSSGMPVWDFVQDIVFAISPIRDTLTRSVKLPAWIPGHGSRQAR